MNTREFSIDFNREEQEEEEAMWSFLKRKFLITIFEDEDKVDLLRPQGQVTAGGLETISKKVTVVNHQGTHGFK